MYQQFKRALLFGALLFSSFHVSKVFSQCTDEIDISGAVTWYTEDGGQNHRYLAVYVEEGITWAEAQTQATDMGGYLASINSQEENDFVFSLIDCSYFWDSIGGFSFGPWLGGSQPGNAQEPGGNWGWEDGTALTYTAWHAGEPNDQGNNEDFLHFFTPGDGNRAPTWNDESDTRSLKGFVVEFEPAEKCFIRGDFNSDGKVNVSDVIQNLLFQFQGKSPPACQDAGDFDNNGALEITDPINLLSFIFLDTVSATAPYPNPGRDPEGDTDGLTCEGPKETIVRITQDETFDSLRINHFERYIVENDAIITVTGDAIIHGVLRAPASSLQLRVGGNLRFSGRVETGPQACQESAPPPSDTKLIDQDYGFFLILQGTASFADSSYFNLQGPLAITDDVSVLQQTLQQFSDATESLDNDPNPNGFLSGPGDPDDIPFPPNAQPIVNQPKGPARPSSTISGWVRLPNGNFKVKFSGNSNIKFEDFQFLRRRNNPPAMGNKPQDPNDPDRTIGNDGQNGSSIEISNDGGDLEFSGVIINIPDGEDGSSQIDACNGDQSIILEGGDGGKSGNLKISAGGALKFTGPVLINPGKSGDGGAAFILAGPPASPGACPGNDAGTSWAIGGKGADNIKHLRARGNVQGLNNISIGELKAGSGGSALAVGCKGGTGSKCCILNGGIGGEAITEGGNGGNAGFNFQGAAAVAAGRVLGGRGGDANSEGGEGGDGGGCLFGIAGDGGMGGKGKATGGRGGIAGATPPTDVRAGDGGNATGQGGKGGKGGDSFVLPGDGGIQGDGEATRGAGRTPGTEDAKPGEKGEDGVAGGPLDIILCIGFSQIPIGVIDVGPLTVPLIDRDTDEEVENIEIDFEEGGSYETTEDPNILNISSGAMTLDVSQLENIETPNGEPFEVRGLLIAPFAAGLEGGTLTVEALSEEGEVLDSQELIEFPDNTTRVDNPEFVPVRFNTEIRIAKIRIEIPLFFDFLAIYIQC